MVVRGILPGNTENEHSDGDSNSLPSPGTLVLLLLIALILGTPAAWILLARSGYNLRIRGEFLGIYVNSILTIGLILIYADIAIRERIQSEEAERQADFEEDQTRFLGTQVDIQKRVADIQEKQEEYIRANHEPVVRVFGWSIRHTADEEDILQVKLKNEGNGLAKNVVVKTEIDIEYEQGGERFYLGLNNALSGGSPDYGPHPYPSPVIEKDTNPVGESGTVLQPGTAGTYETSLQFSTRKFDHRRKEFIVENTSSCTDVLHEIGESQSLLVTVTLSYEDILGNQKNRELYSEAVERGNASTLAELIG